MAVSPLGWASDSRTSNNPFTRGVLRGDGTKAYVGYGMDSLTVGLMAVCRVKFAGETRDAFWGAAFTPLHGSMRKAGWFFLPSLRQAR